MPAPCGAWWKIVKSPIPRDPGNARRSRFSTVADVVVYFLRGVVVYVLKGAPRSTTARGQGRVRSLK